MEIQFEERIEVQARRLQVSPNFVRVRRRVLAWRLGGPKPQVKRRSDIPWRVMTSSAEALAATLQLQIVPSPDGDRVSLLPAELPPTNDLQHGRLLLVGRKGLGLKFGGEGRPRQTLVPPYGYRSVEGLFVPDEPAAGAITDAFHMMIDPTFRGQRRGTLCILWAKIAAALNEYGYCRKDGREWRGDDCRTLIRIPTYAGWVVQKGHLSKADFIPEPLVDLETFVAAAQAGRGRKGMAWLEKLEEVVAGRELS